MRLTPIATVLVGGVLAVQLAHGGSRFTPRAPRPSCGQALPPASSGLDGLAEQLVLVGLDVAACQRHLTRERLLLDLAEDRGRGPDVDALHRGLATAVTRLKAGHRLPRASTLLSEALAESTLPTVAKLAVRALPDAAVDEALPTAPLLTKTVQHLDLGSALRRLDDPSQLESILTKAVLRAAGDQIIDDVESLF